MKIPLRFLAAILAFAFVALCPAFAQPADTAAASGAVVTAAVDTAAAVAQPFIVGFAQQHPWLLTILALIATARLVFKPVVSAIEAYVRSTPQTSDDEFVDKVTHSGAFKTIAWLLDYLGSIKVGPQFKAKPEKEI